MPGLVLGGGTGAVMLGRQLGLGQSSAFGQRNPQQCVGGEQGWGLGGPGGCAQWRLGGTGGSGQPLLCRAEDQGAACSLRAPSLCVSIASCPVTAVLWLSKLGRNMEESPFGAFRAGSRGWGHCLCRGLTSGVLAAQKSPAPGEQVLPSPQVAEIFRITPSKGESRAGFRTRVGPAWGQLPAGLFLAESSDYP